MWSRILWWSRNWKFKFEGVWIENLSIKEFELRIHVLRSLIWNYKFWGIWVGVGIWVFSYGFSAIILSKMFMSFLLNLKKFWNVLIIKTDTLNIGYIMESYSSLIKSSLNDEILESEPQCESIDRNPRSRSWWFKIQGVWKKSWSWSCSRGPLFKTLELESKIFPIDSTTQVESIFEVNRPDLNANRWLIQVVQLLTDI